MEFQASLDNLIIYHEQFITTNNHHLRFLTAQYDTNETNSEKLVTIHILHTSSKNPLFTTSKYNEIENKIRIHWSKLVMTLQLEAILSLMRFRDNIMNKLSNKNFNEQIIVENRPISTIEKSVKNNNNLTNANTFEIQADLEEFRIIIATIDTQMFDVYVQGVTADIHRQLNQTITNLSLTDFRIFDPNINARYQKIISQQNGNDELLSVSMVLYDYPKSYIKALEDIDCYVKLNFAKANIIFLYKYIDQIMAFLDALSISMAALEFTSNQVDLINEHIQNQAFKLLLDATFNAPDIIIPINSSSNEALLVDLGKLNLQTKFLDDTKTLLVEHQEIFIENILASRIKLNQQNEIQSEINLLDCAELKMDITRLLYHEKVKNQPYLSVKMEWDLIHFRLAQDDYLCVMKILMENFSDRITANVIREQYVYQHEQQKQEEDELRNAVIKKQRGWQIGQILENMKVRAEIKKILLTLYLGETSLIDRHVQHNEILKFANIEIDIFEIIFRQSSDMSYKTTLRIKNFQCDDLRETHQIDAVKHIIDRHVTVDSNTYMLIGMLEFKPKSQTYPMAQRQLIAQLESLYICIKLDYLMILQNFFITNLPTDNIDVSKNRNDSSIETLSSFSDNDVETKVQILVKNPEMILLEDQHNSNSYCLALNFTFNMHAVYIKNNMKLSSEINDLTIYSSHFGELEYSKIKYRILQPAKVNLKLIIDPEQQKIDVLMSDIIVNIAPAVFRIFIGVMNTLGKHQLSKKQENFDIQTMFNHKSLNEANFWFLKQEKDYDDLSSDERSSISKSKLSLTQQFILTLNTVDIKLDVGFDLITKSVVAMCLSNWIVKLENWSDKLSLSSTMDIEAALYNEHTLAWEPLIEPTVNKEGTQILPWNILCSIIPFTDDTTWTSKILEQNERISLTALSEQSSSAYRLSVIAEQISQNRQEFSLQINNHIKLISINRTWQRIYNLQSSSSQIQILCDTQIHNNQRRIILSSIVKIFNNTILPIIILDFDLITGKSFHRIENNEDYYVPIDLLYKHSNSTILIGFYNVDQNEPISDFFEFNWKETNIQEQKLQLNNDQIAHLIVYKEIKKAYEENTDQLHGISYCIYIHSVLQLTNLLPIDIRCSIDDIEEIYLKPSQFRLITFGNKNSILRFMIPFYNEMEWISDPIDLESRKTNEWNEQIIIFHNKQDILRMVLHLDVFHETYRLSLYNPFWIINHTDLQLEFRIGDETMFIENTEKSYLFCPEKYQTDVNEKGQIRLYTVKKDNTTIDWSEKFSLDVIKNIGMACCKVHNDKTYMICVDIITSSFDLTKIITLSPAMVIINQISIPIEVAEIFIEDDQNQWTKVGYDEFPIEVNEIIANEEQNHWIQIESDQIIPFWPQNTTDGLMYVRYAHNQKRSKPFVINKKHRTLLYMNDEERLVIFVEVIATDFDGIRIIFSDYKSGDAPVLLINHTKNQIISFAQKDDTEIQYLVPEYFVYYTWIDPLKPRMINIASNSKPKTIELSPHRGILDTYENNNDLNYVVFIDGVQTVLLFSDNQQIIEATLNIPSSTQSICRCFQLGIPDIGISIVNDRRQEELLYISLNQTIVIWVKIKKSGIKLFSYDVHIQLEEIYRIHQDLLETYPNNEDIIQTKYQMNGYREVTFHNNIAELIDHKGEHKLAKRIALDGLWIEYIWSTTNAAFYARINRIQIDNQLNSTNFPSMLYPVLPKTIDSDAVGRPFIELSIYQTKTSQSNIMYFQYFKVLIQEFAFRIEQNIILAILAFLKEEKNPMTSIINIEKDLNHISKSFQIIVKTQTDNPTGETQMYFDNIHLSPLKIHVSFLMHGTKSNKTILAEYPFGRLLLKTLKVADMKDVILRLDYYERSSDRYTTTKLINEVLAHYENQFLHQFHVIILGFDALGNPLGLIRGLAEGVESLFYEPYKGAIEGPIEFAEGLASGVTTLVGSTLGTTAGAVSRITGAIGQSLASITFDEEYKASRIGRRERSSSSVTDIITGGTSVFMGFFDGITGVLKQPIKGAVYGGASGFAKGLGKGVIGLAAKPLGAIADFASTSMNVVQRKANHEQVIHRVRHPRLISQDGLVHLYIPHEAMGLYILNRLHREDYAKMDTYVAHIKCSIDPSCWLMATSKRILFIRESSVLDYYHVDWIMNYIELKQIPVIIPDKQAIEILFKKPRDSFESASRSHGKLVKYLHITDARYLIKKITNAMHSNGL